MSTKQFVFGGILLGLVIALICFGFVVWQRAAIQADLDHEIALAKKQGIWLEPLAAPVNKLSSSENAALIYEAQPDPRKGRPGKESSQFVDEGSDAPQVRKAIDSYLARIDKSLKLAKRASFMPCVFGWGATLLSEAPMLAPAKNFVLVFCDKAMAEVREGKLDAAEDDIVTAARITHQIGQGPLEISLLVQEYADSIVCRSIERIVSFSRPFANRAAVIIDTLGPDPDLMRSFREMLAFDCNPAYGASYLTQAMGAEFAEKYRKQAVARLKGSSGERWATEVIRNYRNFFLAAAKATTFRDMAAAMKAIGDHSTSGSKAAELFTSQDPVFQAVARDVAQRRAVLQAVAILKSGSILNSLPLSGSAGEDPWDGRPLGYVHTANGFVIYGIDTRSYVTPQPAGVPSGSTALFTYPYVQHDK